MRAFSAGFVLWILAFDVASAGTTTTAAILANPSLYDGKHVIVTGSVSTLRTKISGKGNAYETFSICDSGCIRVFTFGTPSTVQDGSRITVEGTFSAVKTVGQYRFKNEIEADDGSLR